METSSIIKLTPENIDSEHICCAFSDKKCANSYEAKKAWLKSQFTEGYVFKKLDVRGKVFIEYVPAEKSWLPIKANNYIIINCFWVSGQFAGNGIGKKLLDECLLDSKGKEGVIVITSDKKRPFMNDPKFFLKQGFIKVDTALPYFQLWCKKFNPDAPDPEFFNSAKSGECNEKDGLAVYYSDCCPFAGHYNEVVLANWAKQKNVPLKLIKLNSQQEAQQMPVPWIINSMFYNGKFISHEIKSEKGMDKLLPEL